MAKRRASTRQSTAAIEKHTSTAAYTGPDFRIIQNRLGNWVNVLECAHITLNGSAACDGCDEASKARNAIGLAVDNLSQLIDQLDIWDVKHTHEPKEASHG